MGKFLKADTLDQKAAHFEGSELDLAKGTQALETWPCPSVSNNSKQGNVTELLQIGKEEKKYSLSFYSGTATVSVTGYTSLSALDSDSQHVWSAATYQTLANALHV